MINKRDGVKRSYDSRVRRERAEATRLVIAAAAGSLFAERGYAATSIEEIAAAAGVGRATVFNSVGGKPELLNAAYRLAVRGPANAKTPLGQQARSRRISAEPDAHKLLAGYAGVMVEVGRRLAPLYEAVRAAAHADPEARELWQLITEERRTAAIGIVRRLVERDALLRSLDKRRASDILWVLNDPGLYQLLVTQRRWTQRRFRTWLTDSMQTQLLEPPDLTAGKCVPDVARCGSRAARSRVSRGRG
jgi:AcrR family transcriptional regulator